MSNLAFQIDGKVVCKVVAEQRGWVLKAYRLDNDEYIGHVSAVVGSCNRPTGQWMYELNDGIDSKHKGSNNWHAGNNCKDAMIKMLKRAKLVK